MPVVSRPVGKKRWSSQTDLGILWDPREDEEDGRRTKLRRIPDGSPVAGLCIPPFTVRKRDRILDAFSIKSERTRSRLPFHPIPDVHDATNEITFSRALGNILIRPSPLTRLAAAGRSCETSPSTLFIFLLSFSPSPLSSLGFVSLSCGASSGVIHRGGQQWGDLFYKHVEEKREREGEGKAGGRREVGGWLTCHFTDRSSFASNSTTIESTLFKPCRQLIRG